MRKPDTYEELEIVGATPIPDDAIAPQRLNPIYRRRGSSDAYYALAAEEGDGPPVLADLARRELDALVTNEDAVLFERTLPARSGHVLICLHPGEMPEYLPIQDLPARRRRAAADAIDRAAREVIEGRREAAVQLGWYARRADPDDPLPLLVLIAFLQEDPDIELLHRDLLHYTSQATEAAKERLRRNPAWAPIASGSDPPWLPGTSTTAPRPRRAAPEYLRPYPSRPGFLRKAQRRMGAQAA